MKSISFSILFLVSNLFSQSIQQISDQSVVKISIFTPNEKFVSIGTGFFTRDKSTIISAFHVYVAALNTIEQNRGGTIIAQSYSSQGKLKFTIPIKPIQFGYSTDLIEFNVDSTKLKSFDILPLKIKKQFPEIGSEAIAIGYFGGDTYPLVIKGIVSGFVKLKTKTGVTELIFDKITNPGQSGSPLLSLDNKTVIGLLVTVLSTKGKQAGLSRVVTNKSIADFLQIERSSSSGG